MSDTEVQTTNPRVIKRYANRKLYDTRESRYVTLPQIAELVRVGLLKMLHADLEKARVLDLFAGTGALGLEAISRGARYADFVETGPSSLHALKANIAALRLREKTRVFKKDALPFAAALEADRYDIVFVDPPYGSRMLDRVIESWQANKFSRILAVEHATDHVLPRGYDKRIFEDTAVTIYRLETPVATLELVKVVG